MSTPTEITTHVADAIKRLVMQFKAKTRIEGLVQGLHVGTQEIETVFFSLRDDRSIFNATGETLDKIGTIVGLERELGQSDTDYRLAIQNQIYKNQAQGTPDIIIDLVSALSNATVVQLLEGAIAYFEIQVNTTLTQSQIDAIYTAVRSAKAAGVGFDRVTSYDDTNPFAFDGADPAGGGFGDSLNAATGGEFASLTLES